MLALPALAVALEAAKALLADGVTTVHGPVGYTETRGSLTTTPSRCCGGRATAPSAGPCPCRSWTATGSHAVLGPADERWGEQVVAAVGVQLVTDTAGIGAVLASTAGPSSPDPRSRCTGTCSEELPGFQIQKFVLRDHLKDP